MTYILGIVEALVRVSNIGGAYLFFSIYTYSFIYLTLPHLNHSTFFSLPPLPPFFFSYSYAGIPFFCKFKGKEVGKGEERELRGKEKDLLISRPGYYLSFSRWEASENVSVGRYCLPYSAEVWLYDICRVGSVAVNSSSHLKPT